MLLYYVSECEGVCAKVSKIEKNVNCGNLNVKS